MIFSHLFKNVIKQSVATCHQSEHETVLRQKSKLLTKEICWQIANLLTREICWPKTNLLKGAAQARSAINLLPSGRRVTYATVIFPIVCVARYVAELVDQHTPARFSPHQKELLTVSKKLLIVRKNCRPSENLCCLYEDYVRARFFWPSAIFTDRHPLENRAGLCFTLHHYDAERKQFSPRGIAWFSTFSRMAGPSWWENSADKSRICWLPTNRAGSTDINVF